MTTKIDEKIRKFLSDNDAIIRNKIEKAVYKKIERHVIEDIAFYVDEEIQYLWSEVSSNHGLQMYLNIVYGEYLT